VCVCAGLGEEFEGGVVGERVVMGIDVLGARPGFEFALKERVGLIGVDEVARRHVDVMETIEEAEVGWGVGDGVFGHAC